MLNNLRAFLEEIVFKEEELNQMNKCVQKLREGVINSKNTVVKALIQELEVDEEFLKELVYDKKELVDLKKIFKNLSNLVSNSYKRILSELIDQIPYFARNNIDTKEDPKLKTQIDEKVQKIEKLETLLENTAERMNRIDQKLAAEGITL